MLKKRLRAFLKVIKNVNKASTWSQIVYTALLASLLLNLVIFIALNVSDSYRDQRFITYKRNEGSKIHPDFNSDKHAHLKKEFEVLRLANVDRRFKSLDERLKKYNLHHDIDEIDKIFSPTTTLKTKISKNKNFIIKTRSNNVNKKDAQRFADERNHRSQRYLRQIMERNNGTENITNEQIRSEYLVVSDTSKRPDIWLHRIYKTDEHSKTYCEYNDGILDQLYYIPESYKNKLKQLHLEDSTKVNDKIYLKFNDFLKEELTSVYDLSAQNDVELMPRWRNISLRYKENRKERISNNKGSHENKEPLKFKKHSNKSHWNAGPDWNMLLKIIYLPDGLSEEVSYGRRTFISEECPVSSCYLTSKPAFERLAHLRVERNYAMETTKPPGQLWIHWLLESPANSVYIPQHTYEDRINWTASFRSDSTIVTPYAKYVPNATRQIVTKPRNYANGKSRLAAWFVSRCGSTNNRFNYVKNLQRHIPVDIFGLCGFLECNINDREKCFKLLSNRYKFYFSFENSNCDYYITEKLFLNALQNDVVPVVMGARKEDYSKAAPPHSFIHVEDFKNENELAEYLKFLNTNDEQYNKYFEWKGNGKFVNTKFWCRLCSMLQDDDKPNIWYSSFENWWMSKGTCRVGRWNR